MRLKIAVCDDDAAQREYLAGQVCAWAKENRHLAEVRRYPGAEAFLFDYGAEKDFDILLLDIEMPGLSGIELAKEVRRGNAAVQIVFVTGFYEYFSDGFDVAALHYLIKPVDEAKLSSVLDRAVDNLSYRQRCVLLASGEASVKAALADILYAEAENVYVAVHTTSGICRTRTSMKRFVEQLDETFFRVHRSYVVNLRYVRKITRTELTMTDGAVIPVSRGSYGEIHDALIKYL